MKHQRVAEMLVTVIFSAFFAGLGVGTLTGPELGTEMSSLMIVTMSLFALMGAYVIVQIAKED